MTVSPSTVDISIVVVNWNVTRLLAGCLDSIQREAVRSSLEVETIVVDSASDDRSYKDVVAEHPDVRLVELDSNRGYGAACNAGARHAHGDALFLLNPDTLLHSYALDELWNVLKLAPHVGLAAPLLLNADASVQSMGYRFPGALSVLFDLVPVPGRVYESTLNGRIPAGNGHLPLDIDYALGAALFFRRAAFDEVGGFDESYFMYSEELDIQQRLATNNRTRLLAPAAVVTHLGGQSTGQQPDAMRAALWESRAHYFAKWLPPRRRAGVRLAAATGFAIDSLQHPQRKRANQHIRSAFTGKLA